MNAPFNIAEQRKTAQAARDRYADKSAKLASDLRGLAWECTQAAVAAEHGDYHGSSYERAVLNAAYDVTECDALYDRINEIEPMQEAL